MCSFLFYYLSDHVDHLTLAKVSKYLQHRGPDGTYINRNMQDGRAILFLHNLLHICGERIVQPIIKDNVICVFNGEIYNYKSFDPSYTSDTQCIIPLYLKHGSEFTKLLDGEFALVLYDNVKKHVVWSTDVFMTKPLFIARDATDPKALALSTYKSSLDSLQLNGKIDMCEPNQTIVWDIILGKEKSRHQVYTFSLLQHKTSLDDWTSAFEEAVKKRAFHGNYKPFVTLSSGYDSGAITLALNKLKVPYDTFTFVSHENKDVLTKRQVLNRTTGMCDYVHCVERLTPEQVSQVKKEMEERCEPFIYVHEDGPNQQTNIYNDGGAIAMSYICREQSRRGRRVVLSGSGADEIMSDYGFDGRRLYYHSEFGGLWPDKLEGFFPWRKFYGDTQRSYLFKDEFVGGAFGIEARYPFLDKQVVQEWIWLHPSLKNKSYKYPLENYMLSAKYPIDLGRKLGFNFN